MVWVGDVELAVGARVEARAAAGPSRARPRRARCGAGPRGCCGPSRRSGRTPRSRRARSGARRPSSSTPRSRAAAVARASGGSPTCQAPVPARVELDAVLAGRRRARARASRPPPSASGRCCRGRRTGSQGPCARPAPSDAAPSGTLTPPPARAPPGRPPGAPRCGRPASSASCPPSASRAACACA